MATREPRRDKGSGGGTVEWLSFADGTGCYAARLKVGDRRVKQRLRDKRGELLTDRERDRETAVAITAQLAARCRDLPPPEASAPSKATTVRQFGELWTSGKLLERHGEVRGLCDKASVKADISRLRTHVYPHIGDLAVADVTDVDVETCFAKAAQAAHARRGKPWRQATKFQVYQVTKRLFDLAIKPGRLRTDNPVSAADHKPRKDKPKLYAFLYPSELLALLKCTDIPLGRRVHYAVAVYTGLRKGSLTPLAWEWIDFQHGTMTALVTKTGVPQLFELPAAVVVLLQRWYEHCGSPGKRTVVIRDLYGPTDRDAETLREDLRAAGVTRALLFSDAPNVQPLRFHDLRATFVTWALRAGKGWGWISARTGHVTQAMMDRYNRSAQQLEDLRYTPFPDLTDAIPELSEAASNVVRLPRKRGA